MDRLPEGVTNVTINPFFYKIHVALFRHTYLLLLVALFIIAYPIIGPGIIIGGDFPVLDTGGYAYDKLWIWLDKGGVAIYEGISRFPITSLWYILSFVNIDASIASKVMILMGFAVASFSFYFSFLMFFRGKLIAGIYSENNFSSKLGAILGALFFAYNIWSFQRVAHWHLWIGYSFIPLFFVSTYLSFKNPRDWRYTLCCLFLWSFSSMTPHMMVFYGIIFASIFLFFTFRNLVTKKGKRDQLQILVPFTSVLVLFVLVNFYWIYPYILGSDIRSISPDYVVVTETTEVLSRDSNFFNTFRMVADWTGTLEQYNFKSGSFLNYIWLVLTFAIPIFAFLSLTLSRMLLRYTLVFSGIAFIGIVLTMGTNSPFDYYKILLGIPVLSNYVWIFRDPDKLSFLTAFAYSFLIGIGGYIILQKIKDTRKLGPHKKNIFAALFIFLLIGSICVYSFPAFNTQILNKYKPTPLPSELDTLNDYLRTVGTEKVYFMPYPLDETHWKNDSGIGRIYQMHSVKPSIESTEPATQNYYKYLVTTINENRSNRIGNLVYPLGTSYLIFHNDSWSVDEEYYDLDDVRLLNRINSLEEIKNLENIGFYNIFRVGNETGRQINLFKQNIIAVGGLEVLSTLNVMPTFSSINSSILFSDSDVFQSDAKEYMENIDVIVTQKNSLDDLIFSDVEDQYIVSPFNAVHNHDPSKVWSKAGATDPLHGEFHPDLVRLGIRNWEFDLGKGLVLTSSRGANITVPVEVSAGDKYNLVIRFLENTRGGLLNVYLDDTLVDTIYTLGTKNSSSFVWKTISDNPLKLEKGRHTLTLENVIGLNAVNVIGFIPDGYMDKHIQKTHQLMKTKGIIYLLEGESNFYNKKGESTNAVHYILDNNIKNGNTSVSGQFRVPPNSDLISFEALTENKADVRNLKGINNFTIFPAEDQISIFDLDFERKQRTVVPLALLRYSNLVNQDEDALVTSRESIEPISGNSSMRVDVRPVNRTNWSILSTDFIPINDERYYEYSMDVRATDVDNFHVRYDYFDSNKKKIDQEIVYTSEFEVFSERFSESFIPPKGSEFFRAEIVVDSETKRQGNYIVDDVSLSEIIPHRSFKFDLRNTENIFIEPVKAADIDSTEFPKLSSSNLRDHEKAGTDAIFVNENHLYNYTANVATDGTEPIVGLVSFRSSNDTIVNSTKYGAGASSGSVLSLTAGSEIYSEVEVPVSSNYTLALRASTCEVCISLALSIDRLAEDGNIIDPAITMMNISLKDSGNGNSKLEWIYFNNTYLPKGNYGIRIHSNSETDLDLLAIYSEDSPALENSVQGSYTPSKDTPIAYLTNYKKINPTKYTLEIKNATRPYVLSLAETYDPLWVAYTTVNNNYDFKTNSVPLYSIINGFHINKTGSYYLTIEYEPQTWFFTGSTVSAIAVVILLLTLVCQQIRKTKIISYLTRRPHFRLLSKQRASLNKKNSKHCDLNS